MARNGSEFAPTPEQEAVIAYRGGHLQVIACAGSGKTEAISRRVASLIAEDAEPASIIAFTFTERAAESMKVRITRRVLETKGEAFLDRLGPMFIGTIHSYCLRLLQDYVPTFGNFDVLDENRHAGLLSREHKRLGLSKLGSRHWRPIFDFMRNVEAVENELIDPTVLRGTPFGACYDEYCGALDRYHFLTYGQLITAVVDALQVPAIYERVHGQLEYLFVDEYQDINPAQERLIELLAQPAVHLCVVGDDDQSIYQWRGSDVSNIVEFTRRYSGAKSLPLSVNRRSRPKIIETANAFATTITPRLKKKMLPHRKAGKLEVCCWQAAYDVEEAETIADAIERLIEEGYRYRDIAVLYRSVRTSSPPLVDVLRDRDIPFRCAGRTGLFLQPEASVLGMTYAWLCDNDWKNERWGPQEPVDLKGLLAEYQAVFNGGGPIRDLKQYLTDWKSFVPDSSSPANLVRDYYRLLHLLGVQDLDLDDPNDSARMGVLARFSEILADFEHVTRRARYVDESGKPVFRAGQDRGIWYYRRLYNYLQYYAVDAYEDFEGEDTFDLDTVDVLTVHQAKGLEWPVVFVPSLTDRRFPSGRAGEGQEWLMPESVFPKRARRRYEGSETDERRLFYVAMTRTRDMLYLSRFERKKNRFRPSPFLLDVARSDPPLVKTLPLPGPYQPPDDEEDEQPVLSFSDLALYEKCPMRYRLSTSLGFQPQLVTELGYGKTIHHVLRRLADLTRAEKRLPTAKEVEGLFDDEFYLPFANRAAFEQLFNRAHSLVGTYLSDYSSDLLRVWETERPFELHLDEGIVNGRADVILDEEGGVKGNLAIVDYKTAGDTDSDDIFAFQLAVYTAAGRGEGINVQAAYLHDLGSSTRHGIPIDEAVTDEARARAGRLVQGIVAGQFPPRPDKEKCKACDVRAVCDHAQCDKYDL